MYPIELAWLTRRTTLDEYLAHWDRKIERRPERAEKLRADQAAVRAEFEPWLEGGAELWFWNDQPNAPTPTSSSAGMAVVKDGVVVYSVWKGGTL